MFSKPCLGTGLLRTSHGWANVAAPLDSANGNSLTNLLPNIGSALDGDLVYIWNGGGYTIYTMDDTYASGVGDSADNDTVEPYAPTIGPGALVFILNNSPLASLPTTNVLAGTVHYDTAPDFSTTFVGKTTNVLNLGVNYVASKLPVGGGLDTALQLEVVPGGNGGVNGGTGQLDGSLVYVPHIVNGNFTGYDIYTVDSSYANGFGDAADNDTLAGEPQVPVGVGIIVNYNDINWSNDGLGHQTKYNWIQSY